MSYLASRCELRMSQLQTQYIKSASSTAQQVQSVSTRTILLKLYIFNPPFLNRLALLATNIILLNSSEKFNPTRAFLCKFFKYFAVQWINHCVMLAAELPWTYLHQNETNPYCLWHYSLALQVVGWVLLWHWWAKKRWHKEAVSQGICPQGPTSLPSPGHPHPVQIPNRH